MLDGSWDVAAWQGRLFELGRHIDNRRIEGANLIRKPGLDGEIAAVDGGVGAAHDPDAQSADYCNQVAELGVEPIDTRVMHDAALLAQLQVDQAGAVATMPLRERENPIAEIVEGPLDWQFDEEGQLVEVFRQASGALAMAH